MPPTVSSASSTVTGTPAFANTYAAVSPAGPAPITTTCSSGRSGAGRRLLKVGSDMIRRGPCTFVTAACSSQLTERFWRRRRYLAQNAGPAAIDCAGGSLFATDTKDGYFHESGKFVYAPADYWF